MASDPNALPESIVVAQFQGIRNTVSRERLALGELETARNVDLDDVGQARRRRGYARKDASDWHSLRTIGGRILGVKDGMLGIVGTDYSFTSLGTVAGAERVSYAQVGEVTYFSSAVCSGKIVDGAVQPWGHISAERTWVSPVAVPTATLGAVSGKLLGPPPLATEIEYYKGRIYLGHDKWLWHTELYQYDYVETVRGFVPLEKPITLVMAVEDGLYVGTEGGLYFLGGTASEGLKLSPILSSPVLRGSGVVVPLGDVQSQLGDAKLPESEVPMFMTQAGICVGLDGGRVHNLTRGRVVFPGAASAAALYREDQGVTQYLAVVDSAGGPSANARIGDFVDAEIVRAAEQGA